MLRLLACLVFISVIAPPARASILRLTSERPTLELAGGIGTLERSLYRFNEVVQDEEPIWRLRGKFTLPLREHFAGTLSFERYGERNPIVSYMDGSGGQIPTQHAYTLFEVGLRIGL